MSVSPNKRKRSEVLEAAGSATGSAPAALAAAAALTPPMPDSVPLSPLSAASSSPAHSPATAATAVASSTSLPLRSDPCLILPSAFSMPELQALAQARNRSRREMYDDWIPGEEEKEEKQQPQSELVDEYKAFQRQSQWPGDVGQLDGP